MIYKIIKYMKIYKIGKGYKIYLIFVLLPLSMVTLPAQTDSLSIKIKYTQKDYFSFMEKNRSYSWGIAIFYEWQNFPNAANKEWMSMQNMGLGTRILMYPLLVESVLTVKSFSKINSSYQIPAFQSAKINNHYEEYLMSLSIFPLPHIPAFKRTQEYISPYVGMGYQISSLEGWASDTYSDDHADDYYLLGLSSWYWKAGCNIFLNEIVPLDLFVEYAHKLNPDKIRNYEWLRVGITFRFDNIFKSTSKKSYSKPLIDPK